ncbi:uncharacterized protein LAJ45_10058 [Morchella importuna]|uniref:uncharacterized protein n=1 Tax=Morchella importuna TaxID=1174673 RepID=UPI001E8D5ACF|nr:uncharacterized protein LAJ45_10058 [Morchella importuna]KAH8145916.1 hypothetical protein LAJ45_10058 [Morchella importuna]
MIYIGVQNKALHKTSLILHVKRHYENNAEDTLGSDGKCYNCKERRLLIKNLTTISGTRSSFAGYAIFLFRKHGCRAPPKRLIASCVTWDYRFEPPATPRPSVLARVSRLLPLPLHTEFRLGPRLILAPPLVTAEFSALKYDR